MQQVNQALNEVKELYQRVVGKPAPDIEPGSYIPFPLGVDPIPMVVEEVRQLKSFSEALSKAPAPASWLPRADSFATNDGFVIHLEVPGIVRENLKVFVTGNELVVRGERKYLGTPEIRPLSIERPWGPFERRFALSPGKGAERVSARYLHGILELRIAGDAAGQASEMPIEVA